MPMIPVYNINGDFAGTKGSNLGNAHNPVATRLRAQNNRDNNLTMFGNLYAEADLLPHLTARSSFGGGYGYDNSYYLPLDRI